MTQHTIKTRDVLRLLKEGKLESEVIRDTPTGRVYWAVAGKRYYYHQAKCNKNFYVREDKL